MPTNFTKKNGSRYIPDRNKFLFNVDTLEYTVLVDNYLDIMDGGLRRTLEKGQEQALRYEKNKHAIFLQLPRYKEKIAFEVMPTGRNVYGLQIRNKDYAFYFAREYNGDVTHSNFPILVEINQFKLWQLGVIESYLESLEVLALLGFHVLTAKPSRIDLCCHTDQMIFQLSDLRKMNYPSQMGAPSWVKLDPMTDIFETVMYGDRKYYQMRIYDKSAELFKKQKYHFLQVYEQYGLDSRHVWNIEFEMRRKFLKNIVVNGEKDFFDDMDNLISERGLSILWTELTANKFKMVTSMDKPDSMNQFWKVLADGSHGKTGKSVFHRTNEYMTRVKDIDDSLEREDAQILGRLKKYVENEELGESMDALAFAISKWYERIHDSNPSVKHEFLEAVQKRQRMYVSSEINELIQKKDHSNGRSSG